MELTCKLHFKDLRTEVQSALFTLLGVKNDGSNLIDDCGHVVIMEIDVQKMKEMIATREE